MTIKRSDFINITISDSGKYADIAYFFDIEYVLQDILDLRKRWIDNKLIPREQINSFRQALLPQNYQLYLEIMEGGRRFVNKYGKSPTYSRAVVAAILTNEVSNEDYSTIFIEDPYWNLPGYLINNEPIAYISERVRACDLTIFNYEHRDVGNIPRNRDLYLMHKYEGLGYGTISKVLNEKYSIDLPPSSVRSAIRSYKIGLYETHRGISGLRNKKGHN